ncbi:hypothetical protein NQZ68_013889 [Dissostichus eleginoides]|nr:hypothetical protein NQZ68_013889 [Dissostichus eleginoides]
MLFSIYYTTLSPQVVKGYQLVFDIHCTVEEGEERWVSCMIMDPHSFLKPCQTSTSQRTVDELHRAGLVASNITDVLFLLLFFCPCVFTTLDHLCYSVCLQILNVDSKQD